jgi:exonuclease III
VGVTGLLRKSCWFLCQQMAESHSVISWNVRGLNAPVRREVVRDMVASSRPSVACLQETNMVVITAQIVGETLCQRFQGFTHLSALGTRGGILIAWDMEQVEWQASKQRTIPFLCW